MVVFLASDEPLPLTPPDQSFLFGAQPLFTESELVLRLFSQPHVYDLSSVGGCACGFGYGPYDLDVLADADVPDEVRRNTVADHEASRESVRLLREFLRSAAVTGVAEVYSCWSGDESADPETRREVGLSHFGARSSTSWSGNS